MFRPPRYSLSALSGEQLAAYRDILEKRGSMPEPHRIWVLRPEMARHAGALGWYFQHQADMPARLSELAILLVARHWLAEYAWRTHVPRAIRAGLSESVIDAVRNDRLPEFAAADEALVYEFVTRLHGERSIDEDLYERAVAVLGRDGVIDLTGLIGYFSMVSATVQVFAIEPRNQALPVSP